MDVRSSFLLGKHVFIKVINLDDRIVQELKTSLQTGSYLPFETNEMIANYLLSGVSFDSITQILTPNTKVLVSSNSYTLNDLNKYSLETYDRTLEDLYNNFVDFNPLFISNISTVILLSRKVDGNLESFLRVYGPNEKEIADALIHLSYIYFVFSKQYSMLHIDPKINNYTWQKLDKPIDITYDFSDNVNNKKIVRKNVSHLFYLTDLEFVYSPIVHTQQNIYFNFSKQYEWLRDDRENVTFGPRSTLIEDQKRGNHLIIVPKISSEPYYDYNVNLFLGINGFDNLSNLRTQRMFVIDILVLVKMILTYDYISYLPASISRILQRYFTLFCSLSKEEEENRYSVNYDLVSSYSFAKSLNSIL